MPPSAATPALKLAAADAAFQAYPAAAVSLDAASDSRAALDSPALDFLGSPAAELGSPVAAAWLDAGQVFQAAALSLDAGQDFLAAADSPGAEPVFQAAVA